MNWLRNRFELSRGGSGHNLRSMEGLRGFAVFLVFLVHYVTLVDPWLPDPSRIRTVARALHAMGNSGVDLFFVLSGYLIYGTLLARPQPFGKFMARRIERIYPAFVAVLALYVALSFAFPSESKFPATPGSSALYFVANYLLLPGLLPIDPIITVAWSLSYEMFFYLTIPLVIVGLDLRGRSVLWRSVLFALTAVFVFAYGAAYGGHVRMAMFLAGMLLYETIAARRRAPGTALALSGLVIGLAGTLLPIGGSAGFALKVALLFVAFFGLCFACFADGSTVLARAFSWLPLRWLGNMSYSYYLLHGLALKAAFLVLGLWLPATAAGSTVFWTLLGPMFAVSLVPAAALFLLVERPFSLRAPSRRPAPPLPEAPATPVAH